MSEVKPCVTGNFIYPTIWPDLYFVCTEADGHAGPHAADTNGSGVVAVWPDEDGSPRTDPRYLGWLEG